MFFPIKATILDGQPTAEVSGQVQQPLSQPQTQQARQRKKHTAQRWMADFMMMGDDEQVALGFTETWYLCMCIYIYTHLLYLIRWGLQDAGTRKNSAAKKIVYIYICISLHLLYAYIPYIIYTHSSIKPRTSLGTWERCWTGSSFLDADSRSCSCTTASWFPSRGTSRRRPIRSTVDWSGVVEPIKKIGDKTVASDFRRF